MAAKGKKKTTMAKLNRERALRERRMEKEVKKAMRKRAAAAGPDDPSATPVPPVDEDPAP
jgi:hypothetical protein